MVILTGDLIFIVQCYSLFIVFYSWFYVEFIWTCSFYVFFSCFFIVYSGLKTKCKQSKRNLSRWSFFSSLSVGCDQWKSRGGWRSLYSQAHWESVNFTRSFVVWDLNHTILQIWHILATVMFNYGNILVYVYFNYSTCLNYIVCFDRNHCQVGGWAGWWVQGHVSWIPALGSPKQIGNDIYILCTNNMYL